MHSEINFSQAFHIWEGISEQTEESFEFVLDTIQAENELWKHKNKRLTVT
jgi:hypothetical protein